MWRQVRIFLVNAPMIFSVGFKAVKAFLHPITVAKFEVRGSCSLAVLVVRVACTWHRARVAQVCGSRFLPTLEKHGITLFGGGLPSAYGLLSIRRPLGHVPPSAAVPACLLAIVSSARLLAKPTGAAARFETRARRAYRAAELDGGDDEAAGRPP